MGRPHVPPMSAWRGRHGTSLPRSRHQASIHAPWRLALRWGVLRSRTGCNTPELAPAAGFGDCNAVALCVTRLRGDGPPWMAAVVGW